MAFRSRIFAGAIVALAAVPAMADPQVDAGKALFQQRCQMCHTVTPDKPGMMAPNLYGISGRKAGSTSFDYSAALKKAELIWGKDTLDSFLTAPAKKVPGTRMVVAIPDPTQRAQVVAYLLSLKK